jgi:uncharacterized membrane protein
MTKITLTALALAAAFAIISMLASSAPANALSSKASQGELKGYKLGVSGHTDRAVISSSGNGTGNTVAAPDLIKHPVDVYHPQFFSPPAAPLGKPLKGRS